MPQKPLAVSLALAAAILTSSACSSGSSTPAPKSSDSPSKGGTASTKLEREKGKGAVKNVFAKTPAGAKLSLYAAAPGHEIMQQVNDAEAKTWSAPTTVFKDTTRFCHAVKLKSNGGIMAATVTCSITAQDVNGTQSSYVLATTDGKTWKQADLPGATAKPSISPNGKFVTWTSPTSFLLWNPEGDFVTAKYTQDESTPTVGVTQDDGSVLLIRAVETKNKTCTISFLSVSAKVPTPKPLNSTLPQPDHPKCMITSAKMQSSDVIANFTTTSSTKDNNGKRVTKTTTFAYAFRQLAEGKWIIKTS